MNTIFVKYTLFIIFIIVVSCEKQEDKKSVHKEIHIDQHYPNSGKEGVLFTIEGSSFTDYAGETKLFIGDREAVLFSLGKKQVLFKIPPGSGTLPVRFVVGSQDFDLGTFTYQNMSVQGISPSVGSAGDQLRISGTGFFSGGEAIAEVRINNIPAIINQISDTLITVLIKEGQGRGPVEVKIGKEEGVGPMFQYMNIFEVLPLSGGQGTILTLKVEGFKEEWQDVEIQFRINGQENNLSDYYAGQLLSATDSTIMVKVPINVGTGKVRIIRKKNSTELFQGIFTVMPAPVMKTVSPQSGTSGTIVEIGGDYFSDRPGETKVYIGNVSLPIEELTVSKIKVKLPEGIKTGELKVYVNDQVSNSREFKVQSLVISQVNPTNGLPGTLVEILGAGFSNDLSGNKVLFNGVEAKIEYSSFDNIKVRVPDGAESGKIQLSVQNLTTEAPANFLIQGVASLGKGELQLSPSGGSLTHDNQGNIYVLEIEKHRIIKINPQGVLSHFAGSLRADWGLRDGSGVESLFQMDKYSCIRFNDETHQLVLSEPKNNTLRFINLDGTTNSIHTSRKIGNFLIHPDGLKGTLIANTLDNSGYIFQVNLSYDQSYSNYTFILSDQFASVGMASDALNNWYAPGASFGLNQSFIAKYNQRGSEPKSRALYNWVGSSDKQGYQDGVGNQAYFNIIRSIAQEHANSLLILDQNNFALRRINTIIADVTTVFKLKQGFADGDFRTAKISNNVSDLAVSPDGKYCYILDNGNNCVRKVQLK